MKQGTLFILTVCLLMGCESSQDEPDVQTTGGSEQSSNSTAAATTTETPNDPPENPPITTNHNPNSIILTKHFPGWLAEPYKPGFSALEHPSDNTYGYLSQDIAHFPENPVVGSLRIPVFLVDWSDFNPARDESNHNNPNSIAKGYIKQSPESISHFLNFDPYGPSAYYFLVSGGQLNIQFDVYGWMSSHEMTYLKDKEPNYYYQINRPDGARVWYGDRKKLMLDVIRSAVVDLKIDLTQYDADHNRIMDGMVLVYEGMAGHLSGTNLSAFMSSSAGYSTNVGDLVDEDDPNYPLFKKQQILFNRYNNIPEFLAFNAQDPLWRRSLKMKTWNHEIGHLLLGYRDYYRFETDLGFYALSAKGGEFHPSAMEKWLFAHWIQARIIKQSGIYVLKNHHLTVGESYMNENTYLYKININNDPNHFLTIENRYFLDPEQNGSRYNKARYELESGLVVFEVNRHLPDEKQIKRLYPDREILDNTKLGAFRNDDTLKYLHENFTLVIGQITGPDESVSFGVTFL